MDVPHIRPGVGFVHNRQLNAYDPLGQLRQPGGCFAQEVGGKGHILPNLSGPYPANFLHRLFVIYIVLPIVDGFNGDAPAGFGFIPLRVRFRNLGPERNEGRYPLGVIPVDGYVREVFSKLHPLERSLAEIRKVV